jgi:hypothetical protein
MAHGMRLDHPIFHTPNEASVQLTEIDTPAHYAHYAAGPVGKRLPAWKVFQPRRNRAAAEAAAKPGAPVVTPEDDIGLVSDGFGFEDLPDSEWISSGVNSKGPESLALGRQANYFLWGFAAAPTNMTPSARDVFVNAVCWIKQFEGQHAMVAKVGSPREWVFVELWVASHQKDPAPAVQSAEMQAELDRPSAERYFGKDTIDQHGKDYASLKAWLLDHFEQITSVSGEKGRRHHEVDEDLVTLGASNRKPEFFERVIAHWQAHPGDELASRLLERYVPDVKFSKAEELATWFQENRARLRFSDFGGFRWILVPASQKAPGQH